MPLSSTKATTRRGMPASIPTRQSPTSVSYTHLIDGKQINAPLTLGDAVEDKDYQNDQPREQLYRRLVAEMWIRDRWKRLTLAEYQIEPGYGIYTDMNAIRADEELGNLHSLYVCLLYTSRCV